MARREEPEVSVLATFAHYAILALATFAKLLWHSLDVTLQIVKGNAERRHRFQERVRVEKDIDALYESLRIKAASTALTEELFVQRIRKKIEEHGVSKRNRYAPTAVRDVFIEIGRSLYATEGLTEIKRPDYRDPIAKARYLDYATQQADRLKRIENILGVISEAVALAYRSFAEGLPRFAFTVNTDGTESPAIATIAAVDAIEDLNAAIVGMVKPFSTDRTKTLKLFSGLHARLADNERAAGAPLSNFRGTPRRLVNAYMGGTPLRAAFETSVPFDVPLASQLEHSMIAAGSRYGKSQLIGAIVANHLQSDDPPGIIVLDSSGDFLEKITRLAVFSPRGGRLANRLLIIDPIQTPQLNLFDVSRLRSKGYGVHDLEQVEADIVNQFTYVFASIGSELTSQQGTGFGFLVRLLLNMPGSNITTLHQILELQTKSYRDVPTMFREAIETLDETTQSYFRNQFFHLNMLATRQGVARRLYGIIEKPTFRRMFTGGNTIDFFDEMQKGTIIVVNTSKDFLTEIPSALFGRYIIARVMSGAFERTVIKDMAKRKPCLLIIDEAQEYFDGAIDTLLTQIGKFKLGLCLAFQQFQQLDDKLRASVVGNTAVKYAGGLSVPEARLIAHEMNVEPGFIRSHIKDDGEPPEWAQFAVHIRFAMERAQTITVPFYQLGDSPANIRPRGLPRMSADEYALLLENNAKRVSPVVASPRSATPAPSQQQTKPPRQDHKPPKSVSKDVTKGPKEDGDAASDWE